MEISLIVAMITSSFACGVVGYVLAAFSNPFNKALKSEVAHWRGVCGDMKKQAMREKRELLAELDTTDMAASLVEQIPMLKPFKPMISQVLSNPELMQAIMQKVAPKLADTAQKQALNDVQQWD